MKSSTYNNTDNIKKSETMPIIKDNMVSKHLLMDGRIEYYYYTSESNSQLENFEEPAFTHSPKHLDDFDEIAKETEDINLNSSDFCISNDISKEDLNEEAKIIKKLETFEDDITPDSTDEKCLNQSILEEEPGNLSEELFEAFGDLGINDLDIKQEAIKHKKHIDQIEEDKKPEEDKKAEENKEVGFFSKIASKFSFRDDEKDESIEKISNKPNYKNSKHEETENRKKLLGDRYNEESSKNNLIDKRHNKISDIANQNRDKLLEREEKLRKLQMNAERTSAASRGFLDDIKAFNKKNENKKWYQF